MYFFKRTMDNLRAASESMARRRLLWTYSAQLVGSPPCVAWITLCSVDYPVANSGSDGVLNGDRESAAMVTLPLLFGRRGGSNCSAADNLAARGETFTAGAGHDTARKMALRGLAILARMDREKAPAGQAHWTPSLRE